MLIQRSVASTHCPSCRSHSNGMEPQKTIHWKRHLEICSRAGSRNRLLLQPARSRITVQDFHLRGGHRHHRLAQNRPQPPRDELRYELTHHILFHRGLERLYPRAARLACWRGFSSTQQGADVFPIPGTKLASRAEENAKAAEVVLRLTLEDLAEIEEASVTQPTIIMEDVYVYMYYVYVPNWASILWYCYTYEMVYFWLCNMDSNYIAYLQHIVLSVH